jgi:hypothetical protein
MSTHPPRDDKIERRLRRRFRERFAQPDGEPAADEAVWAQIADRLNAPRLGPEPQPRLELLWHDLRERIAEVASRRGLGENTLSPSRRPAAHRNSRGGRIVAVVAPAVAVLALIALAGALFLPRLIQPAMPIPPGWHDATPPTTEAITSYAVSPDVPGLILACIGDRAGSLSASPMGPAHIWRTRDGGATWAQLSQPNVTAGCQIAPIRGEPGTFFISDDLASTPVLWVTHDGGGSWAQVQVSGQTAGNLPASARTQIAYQYLKQGIFRDGKLYTPGTPVGGPGGPAGMPSDAFAVTTDDGRSWTPLGAAEVAGPDGGAGGTLRGIAADYRMNGAWFGLRASASTSSPSSASGSAAEALIERSADDGYTWKVVARMPVPGAVPQNNEIVIASTPNRPSRVCVALWALTPQQQASTAPHGTLDLQSEPAVGLPPPVPAQVSLYGSDDGGLTWHGGTVVQYQREYGGATMPGLQIDPVGNCYLATTLVRFATSDATTVWRLAPGASTPQALVALHGILLGSFALSRDPAGSGQRFVAVAGAAGPLVVNVCHDPAPCVEPKAVPPRLIWIAAP